jgi:hypothetical protein
VTSDGHPLAQLRATAAAAGVEPSDADLARAREYLAALLPAFAEIERLVAADTVAGERDLPPEP